MYEYEGSMKLYELAYACTVYRIFRNYDIAYDNFLNKTQPSFDMGNKEHRNKLLEWLRAWGCRQFQIDYHVQASNDLESWYEENGDMLPAPTCNLFELSTANLENIGKIYDKLTKVKASAGITVGPTGASKILFALRKDLCPPWDGEMRKHWKYNGSADDYEKFILYTKNGLRQIMDECSKYGFSLEELPRKLGKDHYSLIKLFDEYNLVIITNKFKRLDVNTIEEWYSWAR
jgi:hypothetical protein